MNSPTSPRAFSTEFVLSDDSAQTRPDGWKRIFQHVMDRADVYHRTTHDRLHDAHNVSSASEPLQGDGTYARLFATHLTLGEERDRLMNAFGDARQGSTAELVSRANDYEARVKAFWCRVQKALEEIHATGVVRESSLSTYRFPGRQSSDGADAVSNAVDGGLSESLAATESSGDGGVNRDDFPAQDSFTYSALGLYNLKPRIRRLGGRNNSFMQDESEIPLGAGTSSAQAPMFDEPQEFPVDDDMMKEILSASPDTLRAPSDPRLVEDLVDGRRAIMRGREPSLGEGSQTAIRTPFDIGEVAPLSLRSFPLRTRDTWDEEREAVRRMAREDLGRGWPRPM